MGMYGDVLKKFETGDYVKLEAGQTKTLRILDHPYVATKQYPSGDVSTRFLWIVWDYDLQSVRTLEQGKSVFEQIARLVEKWPQGEVMPSPFDVVIDREGSGQFDTKYSVNGVPHQGTMPSTATLKDQINAQRTVIVEKNRAIGLKDVLGGAKPELIQTGTGQQAIEAPKSQADVVIEDLDTAKDINLDDIPF